MAETVDAEVDGPTAPCRCVSTTRLRRGCGRAAGRAPAGHRVRARRWVRAGQPRHARPHLPHPGRTGGSGGGGGLPPVAEAKFPAVEKWPPWPPTCTSGARPGASTASGLRSRATPAARTWASRPRCICAKSKAARLREVLLLYYGWFGWPTRPRCAFWAVRGTGCRGGLAFYMGFTRGSRRARPPLREPVLERLLARRAALLHRRGRVRPAARRLGHACCRLRELRRAHRHEVFKASSTRFCTTPMLDAANDALEHGATFYREQLGLGPLPSRRRL